MSELPRYGVIFNKAAYGGKALTALERFILDNEPPSDQKSVLWREQLLAALGEWAAAAADAAADAALIRRLAGEA